MAVIYLEKILFEVAVNQSMKHLDTKNLLTSIGAWVHCFESGLYLHCMTGSF